MIFTSELTAGGSGGSGANVGDYIETERTSDGAGNSLIPAAGQEIDPITYPVLHSIMSDSYTITEDFAVDLGVGRGCCTTASGDFIYQAVGATIVRLDTSTNTSSVIYTFVTANQAGDICCSDDGSVIVCLALDTVGDDIYIAYSTNGGASFSQLVIDSTSFTTITATSSLKIECDPTGTNVTAFVSADNAVDFTVLYRSTDSGASWSEVATPRTALVDPQQSISTISRDSNTVVVLEGFGTVTKGLVSRNTNPFSTFTLPFTGKTAICSLSGDGSRILIYNTSEKSKTLEFFVTDNDGGIWQRYTISMGERADIRQASFNPNNNDEIIFSLEIDTGVTPRDIALVSFDVSTGTQNIIGTYISDAASSIGVGNYKSFVTDGTSALVLSAGDTLEYVKLRKGKFLKNYSAISPAMKVVAA